MVHEHENANLTRSGFLRLAALGAGGLGVATLPGCSRTAVSEGSRQGHVVAVTHGPKDADRVMLALFTATRLPKGDNHAWFAIDGGQLCKQGEAEKVSSPLFTKQGSAARMLDEIRSKGTALHI